MGSSIASDGSFRRYTNLAATIHLLQTREITLLPPDSWDDQNDRRFMAVYKKKRKLKTLTAICLSQGPETYHHWRVFSPNTDGVCIVLNRDKLIAAFEGFAGIRKQAVHYEQVQRLPGLNPTISDLPFIKRWPYEPESEFRILFEDDKKKTDYRNFSLLPGTVEAVVLSPWMPSALVASVKKTLKSIAEPENIPIYPSTLISSQEWQKVADRAK
jgi:hypothetical protein